MKTNFYIHGVLKGQEIWGSELDRDYIKSFYSAPNNINKQVLFVVEIIPTKKKTYCTYLRLNNIFGTENREGSYFGMTVSFDGVYCMDNESLFRLFDIVFEKRIIGTILQNQNSNFRFVVASFEEKNKELETIQSDFLNQLKQFENEFEKIDSTSVETDKKIPLYNISDIDNSSFFNVLRKTHKVYISPEYSTKDDQIASLCKQIEPEKAKNKQLLEDKGELELKLSASIEKNKRYEVELVSYREGKQKLEEENRKLRAENVSLNNDLERNKGKNEIEKSVNQIKRPLDELLRHIRKISPVDCDETKPHPTEKLKIKSSNVRMIIHEFILWIILILLGMLTYFAFNNIIFNKGQKQNDKLTQNSSVTTQSQSKQSQSIPTITYKNDPSELDLGKGYEATIKNIPQGYKPYWRRDGLVVTFSNDSSVIQFKPQEDKDTAYLTSLLVNNNDTVIIEKKKWSIKK
ncbi:MAG: hypothetical protein MSH47_08420 [Bacteroidales bacterium]|nr:hypothetical protein [Bacteroidales bacterium]